MPASYKGQKSGMNRKKERRNTERHTRKEKNVGWTTIKIEWMERMTEIHFAVQSTQSDSVLFFFSYGKSVTCIDRVPLW